MKSIRHTLTGLFFALVSVAAIAGVLTDYGENRAIDALVRGQALGAPTAPWLGLSIDTCADSSAGTEPSGNAYARVQVTASLANWSGTQGAGTTVASTGTTGSTSNNIAIPFPTTTGPWGIVQSVRWYDASTAGNSWLCINLATPVNVSGSGFTISFPPSQLGLSLD